jgi:hypothetical protein
MLIVKPYELLIHRVFFNIIFYILNIIFFHHIQSYYLFFHLTFLLFLL